MIENSNTCERQRNDYMQQQLFIVPLKGTYLFDVERKALSLREIVTITNTKHHLFVDMFTLLLCVKTKT